MSVWTGDMREVLGGFPPDWFHAVVTSPPYYGLRSYGPEARMVWGGEPGCQHAWLPTELPATKMSRQGSTETVKYPALVSSAHTPEAGAVCQRCGAWYGELGQEPHPDWYVQHLVEALRAVRRVLRPDGTLWLNLGDTYAGSGGAHRPHHKNPGIDRSAERQGTYRGGAVPGGLKPKDLMGVPWRAALALQADGWYLRADIVWDKVNAMPEPVRDRPVVAHEYIFLLTKQPRYFYDAVAAREATTHGGTRNARTVWRIPTQSYRGAHFATFPEALVERCLRAATSEGGCCAACGAPRQRVYKLRPVAHPNRWGTGPAGQFRGDGYQSRPTLGRGYESETLGWEPSCQHEAESVPCRVLDPFAGSGTVGVVAHRLGLDCVLIEAMPQYMRLVEERLHGAGCFP